MELERPRDLSELLQDTWSVYRGAAGLLMSLALLVVVPVVVGVEGIGMGQISSDYDEDAEIGRLLVTVAAATLVTVPLGTAMIVAALLEIAAGRPPERRRCIQAGFDIFAPLLAAIVLVGAAVLLGMLAFIIPGIYLFVRLYLVPQAVIVERLGPTEALSRSWGLVAGQWWRVLGLFVAIQLVAFIPAIVVGGPLQALAAGLDSGAIGIAATIAGQALALPFTAVATTLLYFDLRARSTTGGTT